MASDEGVALLDHIIVLLPHEELLNPPKWLTDNFSLTNGGKHADGKTENKLIVFQDGSYIELISFINNLPENRLGHWWGSKPYSIIDWAFTTATDYNQHHSDVVSRLRGIRKDATCYSYAPPQTGGRTRPDGIRLEWAVTFPTCAEQEGMDPTRPPNLPFFCHDITPRTNRVNGATEHACGAIGISEVKVLVDESVVGEYAAYIEAAVNSTASMAESEETKARISVKAPNGTNNSIVLLAPATEAEKEQALRHKFVLKELSFNFASDAGCGGITFLYPRQL